MQNQNQNQQSQMKNNRLNNTTSSLYINSTLTTPNVKAIIQAIATILDSQLLEDQDSVNKINENSELFIFSEEKYIKKRPKEFDIERCKILRALPKVQNIYQFILALYECAAFSPECCIICLVYINRLIAFTNIQLNATNWRPLLLCSLLISQKVWDDHYLSNSEFAYIYPFFQISEINEMEQKLLELLQYHVTIKSSLYAKYYFELRALFKNDKEFPLKPIDQQTAQALETRSRKIEKEVLSDPLSFTQLQSKYKKSNSRAIIN